MDLPKRILRYCLCALVAAVMVVTLKACTTSPSPPMPSTSPAPITSSNSATSAKRININTAILSELDKFEAVLGIPALSHKIQANRPYGSAEELVSKKVISQEHFDQIKDQVTIEEIVLTGEAKDIDYMTKLALMKGHMLVAGELLALKQPAQAEPHLGHPVEEIYVDLEDQLTERQVAPFKEILTQVQDLVKAKPNAADVTPAYDAAMAAIDTAINALPASQRQQPPFTLQVINGLLETATSEYTAAIVNGKIQEAIEYQDSRGFIAYAHDALYKGIKDSLTQVDPKVDAPIETAFKQLRTAWPEPIPPAVPVQTPDQVAAHVKQIEQASMSVIQSASAS